MSRVVREVREKRLIDVEDPRVLPVTTKLDRFSKRDGVTSDDVVIVVKLAYVIICCNGANTSGRNHLPASGIVGLYGQSPAVAVGSDGRVRFHVMGDARELDEGRNARRKGLIG